MQGLIFSLETLGEFIVSKMIKKNYTVLNSLRMVHKYLRVKIHREARNHLKINYHYVTK